MSEEIEIQQHTVSLVKPTGSTADLVENMQSYQELCVALLDDNDWQTIQGKRFPKRSAWRKLAVAYGVSFEIRSAEMVRDDDGNLKSAIFIVRATAPNGRHSDGWGACSVTERNAGRKADHDIPATAETRAKNRAAADLFGMGEVSAEEIDRNAMYIGDDQKGKLRDKLNHLTSEQNMQVRELWKDARLPKLEFLNDEQLEQVYTYIDYVVDWQPEDQEEAF